ncbi:MAG: SPFH domain-containing protein [Holophagales bacterium]|nr:SPFH domain-containing protein [Holophagales bacterium]
MTIKLADVIKYEGDNTTFIWKHPTEDFNTGTQLIVHESQEALFYMNGQALDLFGPGRHTLETQNLPLIGKLFSKLTGGQTPFHCQIYFINKTEQMAIKWGTDSRLEYLEPTYNFPIQIGASGEMSLRVENSRKLLVNIVGAEIGITQQSLIQKFRAFLMTRIKNHLATFVKTERINIFEIDEHLLKISQALHRTFAPDFSDYGVSLERFFVTTIIKPEDDRLYQKFKELHFRQYADVAEAKLRQQVEVVDQQTQAKRMVIEAEGLAQKRALEGYTYKDERGFDVAERVASNQGVGQMSNLGIGLGMMTGIGGAVGPMVGGVVQNAMGPTMGSMSNLNAPQPAAPTTRTAALECNKCHSPLPPNAKFCLECGEKVTLRSENEITCPICGKTVAKGKFCAECGTELILECPACGAQIPENCKFCAECGKNLKDKGQ